MATDLIKLQNHYLDNIVPELQKEFGIKNKHAVPKVKMVKLNVGLGPYVAAKKDYSEVVENLASITGQKPIITKARKAISNFKIRENVPVGVTVTLRGNKMYEFLNKLIHITFPRVRDFRGISPKSFDGNGNYSVGLKENIVFPEINPDNVNDIHGLQITVVTTAKDNDQGFKLLQLMGFPFKKQ
ncbi:50S ribosomal protein L5 [Candidatus Peregrinibacteria bacterium]|nr:50S ribosomal protein L5 [Candidatus Peregrinibacteria bacterium]